MTHALRLRGPTALSGIGHSSLGPVARFQRLRAVCLATVSCWVSMGVLLHGFSKKFSFMMRRGSSDPCRRRRLARVSQPLGRTIINGRTDRPFLRRRQNGTGELTHDSEIGRARARASLASHHPSQPLRPGRRRQRFSSPLHLA